MQSIVLFILTLHVCRANCSIALSLLKIFVRSLWCQSRPCEIVNIVRSETTHQSFLLIFCRLCTSVKAWVCVVVYVPLTASARNEATKPASIVTSIQIYITETRRLASLIFFRQLTISSACPIHHISWRIKVILVWLTPDFFVYCAIDSTNQKSRHELNQPFLANINLWEPKLGKHFV